MTNLDELKPLIGVFSFVVLATAGISFLRSDYTLMSLGKTFMAMFFLTFGSFKLYNLSGFREAFQEYDPLAERSKLYATIYPFIEVGLGFSYLYLLFNPAILVSLTVFSLTVLVMALNGSGVLHALRDGRELQCACLGNVFNVPMTSVTLLEDSLMALMALAMIVSILI